MIMERIFAQVDISTLKPTPFTDFASLVNVVIRNAFVLAGIIAFVLLVLGGFGIITAAGSGDTKKLEQGKQAITNALVGLFIVIGSYWIVQLISSVTGLNLLSPPIN